MVHSSVASPHQSGCHYSAGCYVTPPSSLGGVLNLSIGYIFMMKKGGTRRSLWKLNVGAPLRSNVPPRPSLASAGFHLICILHVIMPVCKGVNSLGAICRRCFNTCMFLHEQPARKCGPHAGNGTLIITGSSNIEDIQHF